MSSTGGGSGGLGSTTAPAAYEPQGTVTGDSQALSTSSDASQRGEWGVVAAADAHHLLKHNLSSDRKVAALEHFGSCDVRDAARDISRMGQRDLQAKFRLGELEWAHVHGNSRGVWWASGAVFTLRTITLPPCDPTPSMQSVSLHAIPPPPCNHSPSMRSHALHAISLPPCDPTPSCSVRHKHAQQ